MTVPSLASAAAGIDTMQTNLNTIGNDIANSQTDGYTSQTAQFSNVLTGQLQPASGSLSNVLASTNPSSVGSGDQIAAIETNFSSGSVKQTGIASNVAIQGSGFLVVSQNGQTVYTLDGDLQVDANGNLATNSGGLVQGWGPGVATTGPTTPLSIVVGSTGGAVQTKNITLGGNIPSNSTSPVTVTTTIYDSLGNTVPVTLTLTPTGATNTWTLQGTVPGAAQSLWTTPPTLVFGTDGQLASVNGTAVGTNPTALAITNNPSNYTWSGTTPPTLDIPAVGSEGALTQFANDQNVGVTSVDGNSAGTLKSYSIGADGVITGAYSNGNTATLGTVALAQFANPEGLDNMGQTYFSATVASGAAKVGQPGTSGLGTLEGGAVDGSNVDLATELTDLIEAQTAYQANTEVVNATKTVLQTLVQIG